jgi:hypothetical protein
MPLDFRNVVTPLNLCHVFFIYTSSVSGACAYTKTNIATLDCRLNNNIILLSYLIMAILNDEK